MKRHGCIDCHLIEPVAGQWIGGRCPVCTADRERWAKKEKPPEPELKPASEDVTAKRLQTYLRRIADQHPDLWKKVDNLRSERGRAVPNWPAWCFMPLAGSYAIASGGGCDSPPAALLGDIAAMATLSAWRPTQGIYRFDPTVAAAVSDTPINGDLPTEILHRLPEWCVYIETPDAMYLDKPSPGFFALLEHDANDNREELRLCIDLGNTLSTAMPVHLDRGGLLAGIDAAQREAARQAVIFHPEGLGPAAEAILSLPPTMMAEALTPRINLILYLCSINAEMRERKSGRLRPSKPTLTKTKEGMRMFPAERPLAWEVGWRLGAAIRAAQDREHSKPGDGTHASPRPHIRRAHWHSFWVGAKAKVGQLATDRKLTLKWLPPIPVNVDDESEPIPTVHPVR